MLADRAVLEARVRAPTTEQRDVFRARIILLADDGDLGRPRRNPSSTATTPAPPATIRYGLRITNSIASMNTSTHPAIVRAAQSGIGASGWAKRVSMWTSDNERAQPATDCALLHPALLDFGDADRTAIPCSAAGVRSEEGCYLSAFDSIFSASVGLSKPAWRPVQSPTGGCEVARAGSEPPLAVLRAHRPILSRRLGAQALSSLQFPRRRSRSVSTTKDRAQLLHCALISCPATTGARGVGCLAGSTDQCAVTRSVPQTNKNKSTDRSRT
jgi:hypothetical protein